MAAANTARMAAASKDIEVQMTTTTKTMKVT